MKNHIGFMFVENFRFLIFRYYYLLLFVIPFSRNHTHKCKLHVTAEKIPCFWKPTSLFAELQNNTTYSNESRHSTEFTTFLDHFFAIFALNIFFFFGILFSTRVSTCKRNARMVCAKENKKFVKYFSLIGNLRATSLIRILCYRSPILVLFRITL